MSATTLKFSLKSNLTDGAFSSTFCLTSLQFASAAGRRAASQGAALAFFTGKPFGEGAAR